MECSYSKGAGESEANKKEKEESSGAGKMTVTELLMKDAKALGLIQGAVSDEIFPRISHEETSKGAWDILMKEFHGDKQLRSVKLQASLKSFELRLNRHSGDKTEKAFVSLSVNPKSEKYSGNQSGSKDQKNWKTKGKKWDNKSTDGARNPCKHCGKLHFGECRFKGNPKCYNCDKFGHIAKDCYIKKPAQQLNYATQTESTPTMFYASNKGSASVKGCDDVWYLDSGYSNHMTGREDVLVDVDKNITAKVAMGTRQLVDVVGKGNLVVDTKMGRRYVKENLLVAGLKENLLSVGQMMEHGYVLIFGANKAEIYDDGSLSNLVAKVQMKGNRSFPLKLHTTLQVALRENVESSLIWHRRMGHLNFTSLKLLQDQGMLTVSYSPQQNGVAERKNRTIMEMAKCMMIEKKMPLEFWAEAVNTAVYVQNRCPTKALDKKTPFEAYSGRKPGVKHLKVFGSLCYAHVLTQQRQKLELASTRCIFLGEEEPSDSSLSQEEISEDRHADSDSGSQDVDHTPLKYKSIAEVYVRCNLCIIEPETFEEAVKDEAW
ncbi:unnamed protein product, partial [Prunus brigantina]